MNPLTNVKNITKLNEIELAKGTTDKKSWHDIYKDSAWIFIGGLAYGLTEGDVLAVFSQYGEIVNINLVRDKKTGKTKGFCFLCYGNQKSTVLAVDNLNGIKLLNRTIRVDHVSNYKPPKDNEHDDEITKQLKSEGCAPKPIVQETSPVASSSKKKKSKKEKKKRKKDKKDSSDKSRHTKTNIKKEKHDPGYDKYELPPNSESQPNKAKKRRTKISESSTTEESSDEDNRNSRKQDMVRNAPVKLERHDERKYKNHDMHEANEGGDKYTSNQKRVINDSESDSDDYVKKKKCKKSHDESEKRISSNVHKEKHKSKRRHDSDTSTGSSSSDNEKRKDGSYKQHNATKSNLSKNKHTSGHERTDTVRRHSSSSTEGMDGSNAHYNHSREKDINRHSRSEKSQLKEYSRNVHRNTDDHKYSDDRTDLRTNYDKSDQTYNDDCEDSGSYNYQNQTHDRRNSDIRGDRSNGAKRGHHDYDRPSHSNDRRSYDYEKNGEYSNRNSSKYSGSVHNIKSHSTEREEKHFKHRDKDNKQRDKDNKQRDKDDKHRDKDDKHRDKDDSKKDWYDRRRK